MPLRALFALLACLTLLPACDSGDAENPGGGDLDGYTGDPDLLGAWEFAPTNGENDTIIVSYDARSGITTLFDAERDGACWRHGRTALTDLTPTSFAYYGSPWTYTVNGSTLNVTFDGDDEVLEAVSQTEDSLTPEC